MTNINIGFLPQLLQENGMRASSDKVFRTLHEDGYLNDCIGCSPTTKAIHNGLVSIETHTFKDRYNKLTVVEMPRITRTGQIYFIKHFLKHYGLKVKDDEIVLYQSRMHPISLNE